MRSTKYLLAACLALSVPAAALAQTTTTAPSSSTYVGAPYDHWVASGFVGSTFNQSSDTNVNVVDETSLEFGGQIAYLWSGRIGAEFLADFSPGFKVNSVLLADDPNMSSYMVNLIAVAPFGSDWRVQPFVSGGIGGIHMSADVLNNPLLVNSDFTSGHDRRWGSNIGAGLMAFAGGVGFRGDVRYFRTGLDDNANSDVVADRIAGAFIDDLTFWRATIGVAFRW